MPAFLLIAIPIIVAVLFLGIMTLPDEENPLSKTRSVVRRKNRKK